MAAEVVAGEAEHGESLGLVLAVDRLEFLVLLGQAALGCHVDHQQHLALVVAESGRLAVDVLQLHVVKGFFLGGNREGEGGEEKKGEQFRFHGMPDIEL